MWTLCAVDSRCCPTKSDPFSFITVTHPSIMIEDSRSHWLIDVLYNRKVAVSLPHPFCLLNYKSIYIYIYIVPFFILNFLPTEALPLARLATSIGFRIKKPTLKITKIPRSCTMRHILYRLCMNSFRHTRLLLSYADYYSILHGRCILDTYQLESSPLTAVSKSERQGVGILLV